MVFRLLDWEWLQAAFRSGVVALAHGLGSEAVKASGGAFLVGAFGYDMTPRCTYADFLCLTTPLVVRGDRLGRDASRLALWWSGFLVFGIARISSACLLREAGIPWGLGHDTIDYSIRIVALLAVIYWWLGWSVNLGAARRRRTHLA